jgi:hypothetical protein
LKKTDVKYTDVKSSAVEIEPFDCRSGQAKVEIEFLGYRLGQAKKDVSLK